MELEFQQSSSSSLEIRTGAPDLWRQVLARTIPQLYSMFLRRGIHPALAEELTQKTVFDAIRRRETYEPSKGTAEQWLFTIGKNNLALEMRNRRNRPKPDTYTLKYLLALDEQPLPDEILEQKETADLVRTALTRIDPKQSDVLQDMYIRNLSARQIGLRLNIKEKAVHNLLYRARKALRDKLIELAPQFKEEQKNEQK